MILSVLNFWFSPYHEGTVTNYHTAKDQEITGIACHGQKISIF
jgi:hypothetical protein